MILIKKFPAILCFLCFNLILAQEVEFGTITKEELTQKEYALNPDAHAAILYRYQNTYFQSNSGQSMLVTDVQERIKIYSKEGFDYATEFINLYNGRSEKEKIRKIKAYTYNLENDKIVKSELDKDQVFESEIRYNYDQVKFTMPNVKEGSVVEFKYQVVSPFIWNIDEFRFQYDIPVKRIESQLRTPEGFNFKQTQKGYFPFYSKKKFKADNRIGMDVVITSFDLKDIPAMEEESYVDNIDNYRAGAMFELVSIDIPGSVFRSYAQTWGDVAKTIGNSSHYKNELDKTRSFDDELDALLTGKTDKMEITKLLFKHVKEITEWNGVDGKYFQNGLKKTLKEKKGNVADINLLLVAMLRYAGVKANPVVLSTKDNAIPFFPTLERLNYVIAHAKINGKDLYMDATDEFSDINLLPTKDYNWGGILVDNENMVWKKIGTIKPKKAHNIYSVNMNVADDGSVKGNYRSRLTNHTAYRFREGFKNNDLDTYLEEMESKFSGIEISNYETKNTDSYENYVSESFQYELENGADIINGKLYFQPLSFLKMDENPFKLETREYPIDFGFPFTDKYILNITVPEGYSVESLPAPSVIKLPKELGEFKYVAQNNANRIQLSVTFEINEALISALNYPYLKEYYNQIIIKEAEQVVLAKITDEHNDSAAGRR